MSWLLHLHNVQKKQPEQKMPFQTEGIVFQPPIFSKAVCCGCVLPRKPIEPLKNDDWKTSFVLKWSLFRGHIDFFEGGKVLDGNPQKLADIIPMFCRKVSC